MLRLQHENRLLRSRLEDSHTADSQTLQQLIDDQKARVNELEAQNRSSHQRILELTADVEDARALLQQAEKGGPLGPSAARLGAGSPTIESRCRAAEVRVADLTKQLSRREDDMRAMEERYKRYLEKAKSVICTLDAKSERKGRRVVPSKATEAVLLAKKFVNFCVSTGM